jgi:hypothetical protein
MANYTNSTKIDAKRFVPVTSRYSDMSVIYYTEKNLLTFKIYKKTQIPIDKKDKYYVITAGTEYRPDLVSQRAYGTVDFWWKIMEANEIKDVFDFKAGLNIRIPDAVFGG